MYVVSGRGKGHFGTQAGHMTRLVDWSTKSTLEYEGSI
jgi:hypothetical protein